MAKKLDKVSLSKRGTYKINSIEDVERVYSIKLYGKEFLLTLSIIIGASAITLFFLEMTELTQLIAQILILGFLLLVSFLYINTVFYYRRYPNLKNYDTVFYFGAMSFTIINFVISLLKDFYDTSMTFSDVIFLLFNFSFSIVLITIVLIKSLVNRPKIQKKAAQFKPTKVYLISSVSAIALGICFIVIVIDAIVISLNNQAMFAGATTIEKVEDAWDWGSFAVTISILAGFIVGTILVEWRYDILFDWDDEIIKPYGMG